MKDKILKLIAALILNLIVFNHGCVSHGNGGPGSDPKYTIGYPIPISKATDFKRIQNNILYEDQDYLFLFLNVFLSIAILSLIQRKRNNELKLIKGSFISVLTMNILLPVTVFCSPFLFIPFASILSFFDVQSTGTALGMFNRVLFTFLLIIIINLTYRRKEKL